ncbi:MAG: helix-turn-helix domain-containing protein [Halioglobus sp.]
MKSYSWPGNVRALRHAVERAVILSEGSSFLAADLQLDSGALAAATSERPASAPGSGDLNLERMEQQAIQAALQRHRYNISKAARELGLTRRRSTGGWKSMVFKRFSILLGLRIAALTLTLAIWVALFFSPGYPTVQVLVSAIAALQAYQLFRLRQPDQRRIDAFSRRPALPGFQPALQSR